jgi:hypothetical protein
VMALPVFLHLNLSDRRQPLPALCSKAFNVGLSEILLGPIFFTNNITGKEA